MASDGVLVLADGIGSVPGSGATALVAVSAFTASVVGARASEDVVRAVCATHHRVRELTRRGRLAAGSACTLVALVVLAEEIVVVNVGDSPGWLLGADLPGEPMPVTRMHRVWDSRTGSYLLAAAIGMDDDVTPSVQTMPAAEGTRVILATDGVLDPRDGGDPADLSAAGARDVRSACDRLVSAALLGPATDNITVAVADLSWR